jgi:hypothetical protein
MATTRTIKTATHHDVNSTSRRSVLEIERDEMRSEATIVGLVDPVQDEIE